eukprot:scaffold8399_cov179-Ochromonas_danica.AAC.4
MSTTKRIPFADLPINYQQNIKHNLLPSRDGKPPPPPPSTTTPPVMMMAATKGVAVEIPIDSSLLYPSSQKTVPNRQSQLSQISLTLHHMVVARLQRDYQQLILQNAFLKWRLAHTLHQSSSSSNTTNTTSTSTATTNSSVLGSSGSSNNMPKRGNNTPAEKGEGQKWATPKKRRLEESETSGIDHLTSSYGKPPTTPASQMKSSSSSHCPPSAAHVHFQPDMRSPSFPTFPSSSSSSSSTATTTTSETPKVDKITGGGRSSSLLDRLATLEKEMAEVHLASSNPSQPSTTAPPLNRDRGSVFSSSHHENTRSSVRTRCQSAQTESIPSPISYSTGCQTDSPLEGIKEELEELEQSGSRVHAWKEGYHYWTLRHLYTNQRAASLEDLLPRPSEQDRKQQVVSQATLSLSPLGEQTMRGHKLAPIPLSQLSELQYKLSGWKDKYSKELSPIH